MVLDVKRKIIAVSYSYQYCPHGSSKYSIRPQQFFLGLDSLSSSSDLLLTRLPWKLFQAYPVQLVITVTIVFDKFISSMPRSKFFLSVISISFIFSPWSAETSKSNRFFPSC